MSKFTSVHLAALALAVCLQAVMAQAQAQDAETRSVVVHTADLDLTNQAGVNLLHQRLNRAAHKVCGLPGVVGTVDGDTFLECVHAAMLDATHEADRRVAAARSGTLFAASGSPK